MNFWRFREFTASIERRHWRLALSRSCQNAGKNLTVRYRCRVRNAGKLEFGDNCILDSTPEHPICLDVGNDAVLSVGSGVYMNEGIRIVCNISVTIGARCLIASDVVIMDDDGHPVDWRKRHNHWPVKPEDRLGAPIVIGENVWIGTRAMILKGVHIGSGAVVAAGAVVTRDVPERALVAGVPAKIIRQTGNGDE